MTSEPPELDALLVHAAWLHRLAVQLCHDQHAAADAAQDTLLAATTSLPRRADNLRGYLAATLRNLLHLQARRQRRRLAREAVRAATGPALAASSAELAARAEMCQLLGRCVLELPEPQRSCVLMHYFEDVSVATVAARCGLSEDAVRGQLRRARDTLRGRLTSGQDRPAARAFAALTLSVPAATTAAALAMTMPIKFVAVAAVAAVALLWLAPWTRADASRPPLGAEDRAVVARSEVSVAPTAAEDDDATAPGAAQRVALATTGAVHVRVLWSDGSPGSGLRLIVYPDVDEIGDEREVVTDAAGEAVLSELPCASGQLRVNGRQGAQFTTVAGKTTEVLVQMQPGVTVHGRVVDERDLPVPTARIWLSRWCDAAEGQEVGPVATDGTFVLRDVQTNGSDGYYLAAFAPGRRVSTVQAILGPYGSSQEVRIELCEPGVSLIGNVRRADGSPAAGQRVLVGLRDSKPFGRESVWRGFRPPLDTRCDARGMFRADGLPPGAIVPVWLHGHDNAPGLHRVSLPERGELVCDFTVTTGATVHGRVTNDQGAPVADVIVFARADSLFEPKPKHGPATEPEFATRIANTDADGRYRLRHVAPGPVTLHAKVYQPPRTAESRLLLADGEVAVWDALLTAGELIRGRVVDDSGQPLVGWTVRGDGEIQGLSRSVTTVADGAFALSDCGDEAWQVRVFPDQDANQFRPARCVPGVRAGGDELRIVIPEAAIPCATITGRVLLADDAPALGARLLLWHETSDLIEWLPGSCYGSFRRGPLPPGVWRVCAEYEGRRSPWTDRIVLRAGTTDLGALRIGPVGGVQFTVRDAQGAVLDGVDCIVHEAIEGHDLVAAAGHARGGALQLDHLRPGSYRVRTRHAALPRIDVPFTVRAGTVAPVAVTIPASIPCVLVTRPGPRGGLQQFRFVWTRDGGTPADDDEWIRAGDEQRLPRHLLPGNYALRIVAIDGMSRENHFTIGPTDAPGTEVVIALP
ncbi:MAG: sigma-70 family RNA polymerase sigma factor [Planctomycetes bacterium]|nr:sigma-70 family RNA polymerase sigma factor [Planctomycetota bacterium]